MIPLYGFCICMDSAFMGRSTPTIAFDGAFDTLPIQCRHIEHIHGGVNIFFAQILLKFSFQN